MDKLVVDDGSRQNAGTVFGVGIRVLLFFALRVLGADYATLAEHISVLLARDFFRHLEHDLDQGIHGQLLRPLEQYAGLAEVFDLALVPGAGAIHAVAQRQVQLQAAGARCPRWPFLPRMAAPDDGVGLGMLQALGAPHGGPVILVLGGAQQANLIVVPVSAASWPGELVGAAPKHKNIHDFLRHEGYFRANSDLGREVIIARGTIFG